MRRILAIFVALSTCALGTPAFADNGPTAKVTADECKTVSDKLKPQGEACDQLSDFNARSGCFNSAPQKAGVDSAVMNGCEQGHYLDALKQQLTSEEHAKYPNQPSALNGNGPQNGGSSVANDQSGGNPGGNNQGGNEPTAKVSAAQCKKVAAKLKPQGDACNRVADFNSRVACFSNAPQKAGVDPAIMNGCSQGGYLDALKQQLVSAEHGKYPNQPDALDSHGGGNNNGNTGTNNAGNYAGGNNGGNGGGNSGQQPVWQIAKCEGDMPKLKTIATRCLASSEFNARSSCFNSASNQLPQGFWDGCRSTIDPYKSKIQAEEHAKYPTQPSALH